MGFASILALVLAAAPVVPAPPPNHALQQRLQLVAAPPVSAAACPDFALPVGDEAGLACAATQAHFARAVWRAPRLSGLRLRRVGFVSGYQAPQRPELPPERTLSPWIGLQLRLDLLPPR